MKHIGTVAIALGSFALIIILPLIFDRPPDEDKMITGFDVHQATYEQLRNMLVADKELLEVGISGAKTTDAAAHHLNHDRNFPDDRYQTYLALLKQVGSDSANRAPGDQTGSICFLLWAAADMGGGRQIKVCWEDHQPPNQVSSLNNLSATMPRKSYPIFRHINENWYLREDW